MKHNLLADVFSTIKNAEKIGRQQCIVKSSSLAKAVLDIMKKHEYIEGYESAGEARGGSIRVKLKKRINDCNIITPRFNVRVKDFTEYEKRFLPAFNIGVLLLTTSKGVMDHKQAKAEGMGGRLLGYVY